MRRSSNWKMVNNKWKLVQHVSGYTHAMFACLLLFTIFYLPFTAFAQGHGAARAVAPVESGVPKPLVNVGIEQNLNAQLPLDAIFKDELGNEVPLGKFFGERPVVLALVYYECPMLCNQVLNGTLSSVSTLSEGNIFGAGSGLNVGEQFDIVAISFDARENDRAGLAAEKKQSFVERYNRPGSSRGWHFLTGTQANIDRVTNAVGFTYNFDAETNQFAHASGVMIATPDGRLARYLYGIEYAPKDMKLSLIEAADEKIGSPADALLLYCFHYDPTTGKYSAQVAMMIIRVGGVLFLLSLAAFYFAMRRRKIRLARAGEAGGFA